MCDISGQRKRREQALRLYKANESVEGLIARLQATKQECAKRYLEINHLQVLPIHHFTKPSEECIFGFITAKVVKPLDLRSGISAVSHLRVWTA